MVVDPKDLALGLLEVALGVALQATQNARAASEGAAVAARGLTRSITLLREALPSARLHVLDAKAADAVDAARLVKGYSSRDNLDPERLPSWW